MKRRSGTSSSPERVYFCDENLGRLKFPQRLRDENVRVEIYREHFAPGTPDSEWLPTIGERGWVLLTVDTRLRYNRLEQDAIMQNRLAVFVLIGGKTHTEKADVFLKARRRIERLLAKQQPPFIAKVYADGRVSLWLDEPAWRKGR